MKNPAYDNNKTIALQVQLMEAQRKFIEGLEKDLPLQQLQEISHSIKNLHEQLKASEDSENYSFKKNRTA